MPLAKVGTFTKTVAAAPATQIVAGVGFQPKALIMWMTGQSAQGFAADLDWAIGFSDGVNSYSVFGLSIDNIPGTNVIFRGHHLKALSRLGMRCSVVSFDPDGFTLNWTPNDAVASRIHYLVLGGADLSAKVGTFLDEFFVPPFLGDKSVVGVGFQPDALLFITALYGSAFGPPLEDGGTRCNPNLGMATATQQAALSGSLLASNLGAKRTQRTDKCIEALDSLVTGAEATLVSMDADGFTHNFTSGGDFRIGYLALKGGQYAIGSDTQPAAPGEKKTTVGFQPIAVMLASFNRVASAAIEDHARLALGAAAGSDEAAMWVGHTALSNPTSADRGLTVAKALQLVDSDAPALVDAEADMKSFDSDGFTLDWPTADAVARQFLYLAIGVVPPRTLAPHPVPIPVVLPAPALRGIPVVVPPPLPPPSPPLGPRTLTPSPVAIPIVIPSPEVS